MKIAFWSNIKGKSGVTTNTVCIAALTAISGAGKAVLLENHYSINSIADIVLSREQTEQLKESGRYYNRDGIEYVLKGLYSGKMAKNCSVMQCCRCCTRMYITFHKVI